MSYKKILIINTFGIGDVLFTTPLIKNIKINLPDAFIGYVANRRTSVFLQNHPHIDRVYVYERDEQRTLWKKSKMAFWQEWREWMRSIQQEHYDVVIDLSLSTSFNVMSWVWRIPQRVGFNYRNRSPLLTDRIDFEGYERKHVVEYYLDLLKILGLKVQTQNHPEFILAEKDRLWAEQCLRSRFPSPAKVVAVAPGGGASWGKDARYKQWSAEKFAQLADKIVEKYSVGIILVGDKIDKDLCSQVARFMRHPVVDLSGEMHLEQSAALLNRCALVVLNDGGLLHVAVATGARTLSIFGPVDERVYGPYPRAGHEVVSHPVPCRPCYRHFRRAQCEHISCLARIEVEDVFVKVEKMLGDFSHL